MVIGLDFDNTIVNYDLVFHRAAVERGLVDPGVAATKNAVRDALRAAGIEEEWTHLQGYVYGQRMREAECYPGFFAYLDASRIMGHQNLIISHKTRTPYLGPPYDLHAAALDFLKVNRIIHPDTGISTGQVFLELTKAAKLNRIANAKCDVFIDDLPELLTDPAFPVTTFPVLFDPACHHSDSPLATAGSWDDVLRIVQHQSG